MNGKFHTRREELIAIIEAAEAKARKKPDKLVRLSPGNYYFFSSENEILLMVSDDSYENGGRPEWVVREAENGNVINDYESLRAFRLDWEA